MSLSSNKNDSKKALITRQDGELTRQKILDAAGSLIAEHGYAAATSKAICKKAQCNLAAVNYHFASREGLYRAVLKEIHKHLIAYEDLENLIASEGNPHDKLNRLIDLLIYNITRGQSWHVRLWGKELLAPSPFIAEIMEEEIMPKANLLKQLLSEITGIPLDSPSLLPCLFSVISPYLTLQVISREITTPLSEVLKYPPDQLAAHLKLFTTAGLASIATQYKNKSV